MNFQKCPKCQAEDGRFIEISKEWAEQRGVRIDGKGITNYDDAGTVDTLESVEVICYECENCQAEFNVGVDGKLQAQEITLHELELEP
jgi:hypothetical protein